MAFFKFACNDFSIGAKFAAEWFSVPRKLVVISQVLSSPAATAVAAAPDFHVAALQRRGKANSKVFLYLFIRIIGLASFSIVLNVLHRYLYIVLWKNNRFNLIIAVDDFCKTWIDSRKACQLARPLDKSDSPKQADQVRSAGHKTKSGQSVKKKR